jgi:antitoxin component of RelBE/YafQ-DinJ toxin-antitoxin module
MAQQQTDLGSLKANAEVFFQGYGMTLSTGIDALLEQVEIDQQTYSAELAEQWANEDPLFCKETYRDDPYFNKAVQAQIRDAEAEFQTGNGITQPKSKTAQ